jgi:hypothetical protein
LLLRQQVGRLIPEIERALGSEVHSSRTIRLSRGDWLLKSGAEPASATALASGWSGRVMQWHGIGKLGRSIALSDHHARYPQTTVLNSAGCSPKRCRRLAANPPGSALPLALDRLADRSRGVRTAGHDRARHPSIECFEPGVVSCAGSMMF